jgi:hypothetical protein
MNKPGALTLIPGRYVGRVGALAVALGVGSAIAAVPLAGADTTASSEGPGISDSATPRAATATAPTRSRAALRGGRDDSVAPPTGVGDSPATAAGTQVQPGRSGVVARPERPGSVVSTPERSRPVAAAPAAAAAGPADTATAAESLEPVRDPVPAASEPATVAVEMTVPAAGPLMAAESEPGGATGATAPLARALARPAAAGRLEATPDLLAGRDPRPGQPTGYSGPGPILAWLRRQFFNATPTLTPVVYGQTTSASGQAVVTGNFGAADADGDTLYYTYIGDPQAGGTLDVDEDTGDFTYTAPASMNSLGGFDQFNVVVSDQTPGAFPAFHGIADLISRIPVIGPQIINNLQLFGLATPYIDSVPARVTITVTPTQPAAPLTGDAQQLSLDPIAAEEGWQRYVLTPEGCSEGNPCIVRPVSLYYKNDGVTLGDDGEITLTYGLGSQAPMVILDYGQDVGGFTRFSYFGATPNLLQASYSESLSNLTAIGDGALSSALLANSGDPLTFQIVPVLGNGSWQGGQIQGGFRYQRIVLNLPGTVTLTNILTEMTAPLRAPDGYEGNFLSNSDVMNRIWYAGAYTLNLDEIAAGTPGFNGPYPLSILGEAAKRDRAIWAGDLLTAGITLHDVFGATGDLLARNSLQIMADNPVKEFILEPVSLPFGIPSNLDTPGPAPGVCSGVAKGGCAFWGASYSMALAQNMASYYRLTGDAEFVRRNWVAIQRAVTYGNSLINSATGLVDVPQIASIDWSVVGRAAGQVASTNMIAYDSLTSAATLAEAIGETAAAEQYAAQAASLKAAINDNLWNPDLGAYDAATDRRGFVVQDANAWAVYYGVADAERSAQIVQTLSDTLTTDFGLRAAEEGVSGYPQIVSPFIGSFSLPANYLAGRPDLAVEQMLATWGYMVGTDAGSTTWERINLPGGNLSGTIPYLFGDSASHAWGTGATSSLSDFVLGIRPTSVAYRTWRVKPFPQGLQWAQGRVPTTAGHIASRWELGDGVFRFTVEVPEGTNGSVAVPTLGAPRVIYRDGVQVWNGSAAVNGAVATATADGYVEFTGVTGSHTWAW